MSVYLDGSTLSALLFSHLNSNGSQYGFLIGEIIEQVEDRMSDSQVHNFDVNSYIHISSFVPWPSQECIYSRQGHISDDWMKHFFTNPEQTLVGWYSFRHNTASRPSMREITLHSSLASSEKFSGRPGEFLFFLCTSSFSSNMSTHTSSHGFMHMIDGHFESVPMTVMNLGDTTRKEYKGRSSAAVSSRTFQKTLQNFHKGFLKPTGEMEQIVKMNHLAASINKSLTSVHSKVFESEAALGLLESDVDGLRQRLEQLDREDSRRVIEVETERRKKAEDERRRNEEEEAEAQERLLINFGISSSSCYNGGSSSTVVPNHQNTTLFAFENNFSDQIIDCGEVINTACSLPSKQVTVNNSLERSRDCKSGCTSAGILADRRQVDTVPRSSSRTKNYNTGTRKPQTMKDKVSEAFSFLDEELKFKKEGDVQRNEHVNKGMGVAKVQGIVSVKKCVPSTPELRKTKGETG